MSFLSVIHAEQNNLLDCIQAHAVVVTPGYLLHG